MEIKLKRLNRTNLNHLELEICENKRKFPISSVGECIELCVIVHKFRNWILSQLESWSGDREKEREREQSIEKIIRLTFIQQMCATQIYLYSQIVHCTLYWIMVT